MTEQSGYGLICGSIESDKSEHKNLVTKKTKKKKPKKHNQENKLKKLILKTYNFFSSVRFQFEKAKID